MAPIMHRQGVAAAGYTRAVQHLRRLDEPTMLKGVHMQDICRDEGTVTQKWTYIKRPIGICTAKRLPGEY